MIEAFLVGVIAAASATASLFFLKFWRETRDHFFLAFAASFFIDAVSRLVVPFLARPNEGRPEIYVVRLFGYLLILAAILWKNRGGG